MLHIIVIYNNTYNYKYLKLKYLYLKINLSDIYIIYLA